MRAVHLPLSPDTRPRTLPIVLPPTGGVASRVDVNHVSPPDAKIGLFRSLFRGRDDVYPRRFESRKTGKSGYSPVCANEWVRGVCEKPRIKCLECPHRRFLSITDDVIRCHLSGQDDDGRDFVMGVYPMLLDETCFFLAADFDKATWQEDAKAFLDTCKQLNLPAALERSRSGNGGDIWLFFREPAPATLAQVGGSSFDGDDETQADIGLNSYQVLSESRYAAARRFRQLDRVAAPGSTQGAWVIPFFSTISLYRFQINGRIYRRFAG